MNWLRMIAMVYMVIFAVPGEGQTEAQTEPPNDAEARELIATTLFDIEMSFGNAEAARMESNFPNTGDAAGRFCGDFSAYRYAMERAQTLRSELEGSGIRLTGFTLGIPPSASISFEFTESE